MRQDTKKRSAETGEGPLRVLLGLLREIRAIDPEFPLHYALCLVEIARDEGLSLTDLSLKTGMPLSTVSRAVGALSARRQKGAPYGLVQADMAPGERRKKRLFLTPQGRLAIDRIAAAAGL